MTLALIYQVCVEIPKNIFHSLPSFLFSSFLVYRFVTPVSSAVAYLYGTLIPGWIIEACMITAGLYVGLGIFVYGTRTFPSEQTVKEYDVLERQTSELEEMHLPTQMAEDDDDLGNEHHFGSNDLNDDHDQNNEESDGMHSHSFKNKTQLLRASLE